VSCHNLPRALYVATGALPETFPKLTGYPSRHARESVVETLLDARPEFMRVPIDDVRAGDLVGLRLFYCTDHLGVVVNHDLCFVHVLVHKLTTIDRLREDPTWSSRLRAAWRPVQ
jgi:uncharacterized protein YijF (DUF1287 family)